MSIEPKKGLRCNFCGHKWIVKKYPPVANVFPIGYSVSFPIICPYCVEQDATPVQLFPKTAFLCDEDVKEKDKNIEQAS